PPVAAQDRRRPGGGDPGQPRGRAAAQLDVRLAAGRAVAMRTGPPVGERSGVCDLDLPPAEALPVAVAEFGQPGIVAPFAGVEAELAADDVGRLARSAERAAQEDRRCGLVRELLLQRATHGPRLLPPTLGER